MRKERWSSEDARIHIHTQKMLIGRTFYVHFIHSFIHSMWFFFFYFFVQKSNVRMQRIFSFVVREQTG